MKKTTKLTYKIKELNEWEGGGGEGGENDNNSSNNIRETLL